MVSSVLHNTIQQNIFICLRKEKLYVETKSLGSYLLMGIYIRNSFLQKNATQYSEADGLILQKGISKVFLVRDKEFSI